MVKREEMAKIHQIKDGKKPPCNARPEVGEIDTRAPFESVKAAVGLFGEVAICCREQPLAKKSNLSSGVHTNNSIPLPKLHKLRKNMIKTICCLYL